MRVEKEEKKCDFKERRCKQPVEESNEGKKRAAFVERWYVLVLF